MHNGIENMHKYSTYVVHMHTCVRIVIHMYVRTYNSIKAVHTYICTYVYAHILRIPMII